MDEDMTINYINKKCKQIRRGNLKKTRGEMQTHEKATNENKNRLYQQKH